MKTATLYRHFEQAERSVAKREISRAYAIGYISARQEISPYGRNDALISPTFCNELAAKYGAGMTYSRFHFHDIVTNPVVAFCCSGLFSSPTIDRKRQQKKQNNEQP